MKDSIWGMFVDRPYLYMQYGTHDVEVDWREEIEIEVFNV